MEHSKEVNTFLKKGRGGLGRKAKTQKACLFLILKKKCLGEGGDSFDSLTPFEYRFFNKAPLNSQKLFEI